MAICLETWSESAMKQILLPGEQHTHPKRQRNTIPICVDGLISDFDDGFKQSNIREASHDDIGYSLRSCVPCLMISWPYRFDALAAGISERDFWLQGDAALMIILEPSREYWYYHVGNRTQMIVPLPKIRQLNSRLAKLRRKIADRSPDFAAQATLRTKYMALIGAKGFTTAWLNDLPTQGVARGCELIYGSHLKFAGNVQIVSDNLTDLQALLASLANKHTIKKMESCMKEYTVMTFNLSMTAMIPEGMECAVRACTGEEAKMVQMKHCWCTTDRQSKFPLTCFETGCNSHIPLPNLIENLEVGELLDLAKEALQMQTR
ncbi:hypothetical protein LTR78_000720 [Recurvomyces mirabilis]|uniref:Uncharacterized protein n=1 Tax=Recurvomyces mirabilis TaxID=574656 RepID=A0AAE0WWD3_9PEZI|nr:hypothetical protein LTR78_000720 [Recurvomyces mirabilis]KAK5158690.1 hypothetical protein LTS14_002798 [Recurvomyces mirabilis]